MLKISFPDQSKLKNGMAGDTAQRFCEKEHTGAGQKKILPREWDQENGLLRPISCSPAGLIYTKHNL